MSKQIYYVARWFDREGTPCEYLPKEGVDYTESRKEARRFESAELVRGWFGDWSFYAERRDSHGDPCGHWRIIKVTVRKRPKKSLAKYRFEIGSAVADVFEELGRARAKFPNMCSAHEGYAILLEEVRELEKEVFWGTKENMRAEAVQVAAMALRLIEDVCDKET